jgi:hypothetical protein
MFKFYFSFIFLTMVYCIEQNTSFRSSGTRQAFTDTLYYDNLSIFRFTFCYTNVSNR